MFPPMRAFLNHLVERGYTKRTVALVENGSWAPSSGRAMGELLGRCKDLRILPGSVRILSAMSEENREQLASLARQLCAPEEETEKSAAPGTTKRYVCKICGYVYEGEQLPADFVCPICKRGAEDFEEIK